MQAIERIVLDAGHNLVTRCLNGRVEGDGQGELLRFSGKAANLGENTCSGDGDMTSTDLLTVLAVEDAHGFENSVVVEEGLALTHKDDA